MRIPILTFGAIASIIAINSVFADTTVTSKQYVDTTRQATIPAAGTNYDENGGGVSVVTYTEDAGVLGERGICNDPDEDDCNDGDLVTNSLLNSTMNWVDENIQNMPTTITTNKTCAGWLDGQPNTDENCILWELVEQDVYGRCTKNSDCNCSNSPDTPYGYCGDGACRCIDTEPSR